jgi:hypothetical protein
MTTVAPTALRQARKAEGPGNSRALPVSPFEKIGVVDVAACRQRDVAADPPPIASTSVVAGFRRIAM